MKVVTTRIPDLILLELGVFGDERGSFFENFNARAFEKIGIPTRFVQDNISRSQKNVLRGLHYQVENIQGKLVSVLDGEVFDIAIDLRKKSSSFGKYVSTVLSADQPKLFWIPPGFAHGFLVLSETATVFYKVTDYYNPQAERTIRWDDPTLNIDWPLKKDVAPILSKNDSQGVNFTDAEVYPF